MKNTIITSVSALVFLVIGLFIGKSNKQIEIQTVVKTNTVEKVVEAEITPKIKVALGIHQRIENAINLDFDKLPIGIDELKVVVVVDNKYKDQINAKQITDLLEFEARKIGIKINDESNNKLFYVIGILELDNKSEYVFTDTLSFLKYSLCFATPDKTYAFTPSLWEQMTYGIVGKNKFNQKKFDESASTKMVSFCNRLLETREK